MNNHATLCKWDLSDGLLAKCSQKMAQRLPINRGVRATNPHLFTAVIKIKIHYKYKFERII
jgi:hypothetical protein